MSFVQELAVAIDGARGGAALDTLSRSLWQGLSAGAPGGGDAPRFAEVIHAKRTAGRAAAEAQGGQLRQAGLYLPRRPQRPPVRAVAIGRRRRLAASGPLPPALAARFTVG